MYVDTSYINYNTYMIHSYSQITFCILFIFSCFIITDPFRLGFVVFILAFGMFLINKGLVPFLNNLSYTEAQTIRRKNALKTAKIYLAPYKSIWSDLKLSNKYCYLTLDKDGVTISAKEKAYPYRKFNIINSAVHNYTDLWDMFCLNFSHHKTYEGLLSDCKTYVCSVYEYSEPQNKCHAVAHEVKQEKNGEKPIILPAPKSVEKLDINNCSEVELTALPGISIVMSKKVIKKREDIGGFKTIDDFFLFLKLKPHMETQLREKVCVHKMKGVLKKVERNSERSVDL